MSQSLFEFPQSIYLETKETIVMKGIALEYVKEPPPLEALPLDANCPSIVLIRKKYIDFGRKMCPDRHIKSRRRYDQETPKRKSIYLLAESTAHLADETLIELGIFFTINKRFLLP